MSACKVMDFEVKICGHGLILSKLSEVIDPRASPPLIYIYDAVNIFHHHFVARLAEGENPKPTTSLIHETYFLGSRRL